MKNHEVEALVASYKLAVQAICETHNAPLDHVFCSGALSKSQQKAGNVGRIYLILADDAPGWRAKDNSKGRLALKTAIKEFFLGLGVSLAVLIQASYSELIAVELIES